MNILAITSRFLVPTGLAGILAFCLLDAAGAQSSADNFEWKTLTINIGETPGGTYDVYTRLFARHVRKYLPGSPTITVNYTPGAGGMTMANRLFNTAPKDGTEIAMLERALPTAPLLNSNLPARFESDKFNWIGSMNKEVAVLLFWQTPPVTLDDVLSGKPYAVGATGATSDGAMFVRTMNSLLGTKLKVIPAYPGGQKILMAIESGELAGTAATTWSAVRHNRPDWLRDRKAAPLMQMTITRNPILPDVPSIKEYVKAEIDRQVIDVLLSCQDLGRPLVAPPGLPPERVERLRQAFLSAMNDPEMAADAQRLGLDLDYVSGVDAQAIITKLVNTPAAVLERARVIHAR